MKRAKRIMETQKAVKAVAKGSDKQGQVAGIFEITGVIVRWVVNRGFGFIQTNPGQQIAGDIFLHASKLKKWGHVDYGRGSRIVCMVQTAREGDKGPNVIQVLKVEDRPAQSYTVKFFNTQEGFGFLEPIDDGPDIFVHSSVLKDCGIEPADFNDGREVIVYDIDRNNLKGPKAVELQLV